MVPRRLTEYRKGKGLHLNDPVISVPGVLYTRKDLRTKKLYRRSSRLKRPNAPQHLASVIPGHPDRSNPSSSLIYIQVGSVRHVTSSVREVHTPLGIGRKAREKFLSDRNHVVWLRTGMRYTTCNQNVL